MKKLYIVLTLLAAVMFSACDDGRIFEKEVVFKEGRTVKLTGNLTGVANWSDGYNVAIAGFDDDDAYAVISKVITATGDDGSVSIALSGIDDEATHVELCVLNRLRQRVLTFKELPLEQTADTIYFEVGNVDVSMLDAIQYGIFDNSCTACHGASGRAAAGLDLTKGNSYANMVNRPSGKIDDSNIVTPGDVEGSVLHQVLNTDVSASWRQNHADMLNKDRTAALLTLIDDWIANGAQE